VESLRNLHTSHIYLSIRYYVKFTHSETDNTPIESKVSIEWWHMGKPCDEDKSEYIPRHD
jgi:hypothetical protein